MDELRWVHVDDALLAVDKPGGWLAVPGRGPDKADCLWSRVRLAHPDALVVRRLDMATSGLMLFARGPAMQRALSRAFELRRVIKTYVACVHGCPAAMGGRIELPLAADWPRRPRQRVDLAHGRPAVTDWWRLDHDATSDTCRMLLRPRTGRTHQLRVHLMALGHPIVGDALYAPAGSAGGVRLMLHAAGLELPHPAGGAELQLHSAPPF